MLKQKRNKLYCGPWANEFIKDIRFSQVYNSKIELYIQSLKVNKDSHFKIDCCFWPTSILGNFSLSLLIMTNQIFISVYLNHSITM